MTTPHPKVTDVAKGDVNKTLAEAKSEDVSKAPISNYWRILSFGTRVEHGLLVLATVAAAASGVALPLMNIVFGSLTGNFNDYSQPGTTLSASSFRDTNSRYALYFVYLFIGKFVLTYIGMFCFRIAGLRVSSSLRLSYLRALFAAPIRKLDHVSTGTVAATITSSADTIQGSISDRLSNLFQSIALVIAAYAIAFTYSWALTLVVSSAILFVLVMGTISTPFALKAMQRVDKADEKHATVSSEALSSIRTVFALGAEDKMMARYSRWVEESHKSTMSMGKWLAAQMCPFMFATYTSYALAFWFGLKLFREGHIESITNVIVVFFSVLIVTTVLGRIATPIMYIGKAISASTTFFEAIDGEKVDTTGLKTPDVSPKADIVFEDVNFAYPTRASVQVLSKFNVRFQSGKTTAIVGPSGSGKSTIVALLERWYSLRHDSESEATRANTPVSEKQGITSTVPDSSKDTEQNLSESGQNTTMDGIIRIGDNNIEDCDLIWWRTQIGLVQQEPFLFNDTIEKNVGYGLIGTQWEDANEATKKKLIEEACIEAFADEFIRKLPSGYASRVGEGGIKLSGGQRQRLAIARSIVRKPSILILDEATSAIDVRSEKIVQQALDRASRDRTTIVIAHRLSTIQKADHIIVMRAGQVIEQGKHAELLAIKDGLYQALTRAQGIEEQLAESGEDDMTVAEGLSRKSTRQPLDNDESKTGAKSPSMIEDYKNRGLLRSIGPLLGRQRSRSYHYILMIIAAMVCGAAYALQSWFFAQLIQAFAYTGQRLIDAANFWALMFFVLAIVVTLSYVVLIISAGRISGHVGAQCRREYFRDALRMPIQYYDEDDNSSGAVMSRLSGDPKQVQDLIGPLGALPLISVFNVIASVIVSFYFGWKLTLVVFFAVMPVIMVAAFLRMRFEVQFDAHNAKVFSSSSQFATEAISAFRTVSALTMERVVLQKYEAMLNEQIRATTRKSSYAILVFALSDSVELLGMALTFWYGGQLLATREYDIIQFFVIFSAIVQGAQAAGQYLSITPNLATATAAANRILGLQHKVCALKPVKEMSSPASPSSLGCRIAFKNVTFQYPSADTPLFTELDFTIEPGQYVAFVGPSGCGKTSIISMLERFYEPRDGQIYVDGHDIALDDAREHRRNIALVSQEPRLFSGTVRENLLIGVDAETVSEEQIEQACRDAEIHDFLVSLPEGYATELGQSTHTSLSGGQKQRLCLARALLRRPQLLLLDEATSSLDSQSERLVQSAIERLAGQRSMTVIAVAHRLATIQKADVIFVFGQRDAEGRQGSHIIEKGSHAELSARRGVYWGMCKAQALDR